MKEIVIISGKGGTGKTMLTASLACLSEDTVPADCDVDAPDLHILADPQVIRSTDFVGGGKARIDREKCTSCGVCRDVCRFDAVSEGMEINRFTCEGCGVCVHACPEEAVTLEETVNGQWFISETRFGPMVHAQLKPGEENSGRLVALVRREARELAKARGKEIILVDGAPGVGCPVISSITAADHVVIVAEPTMSGLHDMERVLQLVNGFRIPASVVVNKWDLNEDMAQRIKESALREGASFLGGIPYDSRVIKALVQRRCIVEDGDGPADKAVRDVWKRIRNLLGEEPRQAAI